LVSFLLIPGFAGHKGRALLFMLRDDVGDSPPKMGQNDKNKSSVVASKGALLRVL
jgi:hypothetical protein